MKFSYNWLKELVNFKESPQQLAEFLTLRAFEVESVDKIGNDWAINISGKTIGPRMADASGHLGMAREIAALKNIRVKSQEPRIKKDKKRKTADTLKIKIENPENCPRYTVRIMEGVRISPSPAWLRERLETCGLQSINNIVDATNYVMLETGQPMHVFDYDKIGGKQIVIRRAKKGEKILALDEKTYNLSSEILVIANEKEPMAIAGIKGGKTSGVSESTQTIVLESANFAPQIIRRASQKLQLRTDASIRFEHGLDPNQTTIAIDRLAIFIQQLAGGKILDGLVDAYPKPQKPRRILFRPAYANDLIGVKIGAPQYMLFFQQLGFPLKKKGVDFIVEIPTNRLDLVIEEDLIEEVARLYGYERISARMPETALLTPKRNDELYWEDRVQNYLAGAGFSESLLYEFTGDKELDQFFVEKIDFIEIENPANPETKYLTPRVLTKYIFSTAENLRNFDTVKIFGIGKSFREARSTKREARIYEHKDLIITLAKKSASGEEEFYQLKGVLDQLFENLGLSDIWYDDVPDRQQTPRDKFHPYRFAEIKIGDEKIGVLGEIHPEVSNTLKAKARIVTAEINFEKLWQLATSEAEYRPIGKYPVIMRDIAIIVPQEIRTVDVENVIQTVGGLLLIDVDLFDYFQDEKKHEAEEKSLAFHLIFQSSERTLRDEEIDASVKKIIQALEEKNWEVRK